MAVPYSNVNFQQGAQVSPNVAFVEIGTDGGYCYDGAAAGHELAVDELAILSEDAVISADPTRVLDTRSGLGVDDLTTIPNNPNQQGISVEYVSGNLILDASNFSLEYCFYEPTLGLPGYVDSGFSFRIDGFGKDPDPTDFEEVVYLYGVTKRTNIDETYNSSVGGGPDGVVGFGGSNFYAPGQVPSDSQLNKLVGVADLRIIDNSNGYKEGEYRVEFDVPCERTG